MSIVEDLREEKARVCSTRMATVFSYSTSSLAGMVLKNLKVDNGSGQTCRADPQSVGGKPGFYVRYLSCRISEMAIRNSTWIHADQCCEQVKRINGIIEGIHGQKHIDHARIGDRHVSAKLSLSKRELVFFTLLPKIPYCYKTHFLGSGIYIPTRAYLSHNQAA